MDGGQVDGRSRRSEVGSSQEELIDQREQTLAVTTREKTEEVDVGDSTTPKLLKIAEILEPEFKERAIKLLREYRDVFAWSYQDLKGVPPNLCTHRIELLPSSSPKRQAPYRMNPTFMAKVKEEVDKLLQVGFIYPIENA